jgi:acyl carrier protein
MNDTAQDDPLLQQVIRAILTAAERKDIQPAAASRVIDDLGFDSLQMSVLAIALESETGCTVLLNDWIVSAPSLSDLTVSSLVAFLRDRLAEE